MPRKKRRANDQGYCRSSCCVLYNLRLKETIRRGTASRLGLSNCCGGRITGTRSSRTFLGTGFCTTSDRCASRDLGDVYKADIDGFPSDIPLRTNRTGDARPCLVDRLVRRVDYRTPYRRNRLYPTETDCPSKCGLCGFNAQQRDDGDGTPNRLRSKRPA